MATERWHAGSGGSRPAWPWREGGGRLGRGWDQGKGIRDRSIRIRPKPDLGGFYSPHFVSSAFKFKFNLYF